MDESIIENTDSEIVTETPTDTGEVTLTVDDYNAVVAEKKALEEKNAKLYARLKKAETSRPLEKAPIVKESPEFSQDLAKLKLATFHGIKDQDAIDFIMKNGGEEALKNPFVKQTIDAMLAQKAAEAAVISEETQKSDFERKISREQLKAMSSEEMEKHLPHV